MKLEIEMVETPGNALATLWLVVERMTREGDPNAVMLRERMAAERVLYGVLRSGGPACDEAMRRLSRATGQDRYAAFALGTTDVVTAKKVFPEMADEIGRPLDSGEIVLVAVVGQEAGQPTVLRGTPLGLLRHFAADGIDSMTIYRVPREREDEVALIVLGPDHDNDEIREGIRLAKSARARGVPNVVCTISGFDDDPRELFEIPEARAFCRRLVGQGVIGHLDTRMYRHPEIDAHPLGLGALEIWACSEGLWKSPTTVLGPAEFEEFGHAVERARDISDGVE